MLDLRRFSLVVARGRYSLVEYADFSLPWLLRFRAWALVPTGSTVVACGVNSCSSSALEHRLNRCGAWA